MSGKTIFSNIKCSIEPEPELKTIIRNVVAILICIGIPTNMFKKGTSNEPPPIPNIPAIKPTKKLPKQRRKGSIKYSNFFPSLSVRILFQPSFKGKNLTSQPCFFLNFPFDMIMFRLA